MKFTLSWLKEHLDTDASLDEIRDRLTMLGLEVEGITNPAEALARLRRRLRASRRSSIRMPTGCGC